jgi:hypothetical protein
MRPNSCLIWMLALIAPRSPRQVAAADVPQIGLTEWPPPECARSGTIGSGSSSHMAMY